LHYAVPQGASGTLSVYVNAASSASSRRYLGVQLITTSKHQPAAKTHKLYDDVRMIAGPERSTAGGTVKLQVDSGNTATPIRLTSPIFFTWSRCTQPPIRSR